MCYPIFGTVLLFDISRLKGFPSLIFCYCWHFSCSFVKFFHSSVALYFKNLLLILNPLWSWLGLLRTLSYSRDLNIDPTKSQLAKVNFDVWIVSNTFGIKAPLILLASKLIFWAVLTSLLKNGRRRFERNKFLINFYLNVLFVEKFYRVCRSIASIFLGYCWKLPDCILWLVLFC